MVSTTPQLEAILAEFPNAKRDALIPILQRVQEAEGFLSKDAMIRIGQHLELPVSKVFGVATFYNQFRFHKKGAHHCQVCRGTACHVKGSDKVLASLQEQLGIMPGETTRDGQFSIEVVACVGACGLAPVITDNGEFLANQSADSVRRLIDKHRKDDEAAAASHA